MQLSRRLKAVADLVTQGNRVSDVGCDHAYISIYLIEHNIAKHVIAMDVNKGPLLRAKANISKKNLLDRIETRLSDGLEKLKVDEVDTILLAGMGGVLMIRILEEGRETVASAKELILQPQSEIASVRKYLHSIGFSIVVEHMLIEDGKYYDIIKAVRSIKDDRDELSYEKEVFYQYGKLMLENKDEVLFEYLLKEKETYERVLETLSKTQTDKTLERYEEVKSQLAIINEALLYFNNDDVLV